LRKPQNRTIFSFQAVVAGIILAEQEELAVSQRSDVSPLFSGVRRLVAAFLVGALHRPARVYRFGRSAAQTKSGDKSPQSKMRSTLFYIPEQIGPIPFLKPAGWDYGVGLLLAVVLLCGGIILFSKYRRQRFGGDFLGSLAALVVVALVIVFILPKIMDEEGRGLAIRGYGMMLLVAVLSAVALGMWRARQVGANPEIILSMMFFIFVGGLVGGRGLFVIQYWNDFKPRYLCPGYAEPPVKARHCGQSLYDEGDGRHYCSECDAYWTADQLNQRESMSPALGRIVNVTTGGLVVFGALIGAAVPFCFYTWHYGLPILALCDIVVASLLLGQGLGRVGCLLNGCCFGGVCDLPQLPAITFPWRSPAHDRQVEKGEAFLHGMKLTSKDELPGNPKPKVIVNEVQPGSPAETAGIRSGQYIVGLDPLTDSRRKTDPARIHSSPSRRKLLNFLFSVDGKPSRDRITLMVALEGKEFTPVTWAVTLADSAGSLAVHPTQLYDAINASLMALFAWCYFPFRRRDGEVFAVMLTIFPVSRFLMEWIRTDELKNWFVWDWLTRFGIEGFTISQVISMGLIASAIPFWYFVLRQTSGGKLTPDDWQAHNARWAAGVSGE
jgi:phosphatidylglycerol:prolipoprotein diacylglycerol transferase